MKKTYQSPIQKIVVLKACSTLMAGSPYLELSGKKATGAALGRDFDAEDDFEE